MFRRPPVAPLKIPPQPTSGRPPPSHRTKPSLSGLHGSEMRGIKTSFTVPVKTRPAMSSAATTARPGAPPVARRPIMTTQPRLPTVASASRARPGGAQSSAKLPSGSARPVSPSQPTICLNKADTFDDGISLDLGGKFFEMEEFSFDLENEGNI